jgi:putative DNA primase/helicase
MPLRFTDGIDPERVRWLWPGYIPFGKVTVLDGDPGLGKSTVMIDLASRLSRGDPLPNGKQHRPMGTILLMGEDGAGDTIVPRIENAGGDRAKIAIRDTYTGSTGDEIPPGFPSDVPRLKQDIIEARAGMVVIDPVMSYLDPDINSNNDQQVRRALMPLAALAEETGAAIVLLRHLNKSSGGSALYRGGGSIGFVGVSRSALILARDPDEPGRVVLASNKTNLGPPPPSLHFRLAGCDNGAARIDWEGLSAHTAETLMRDQGNEEDRGAMGVAVAFLREVLAGGPMLAKTVQRQARDAQIADRTLRRARESLGIRQDTPYIKKANTQDGQFTWELPPAPKVATDVGQAPNMVNLDTLANFTLLREEVQGGQPVQAEDVATFDSRIPVAGAGGKYHCVECQRTIIRMAGQALICKECLGSKSAATAD